MSDEDRSKFKDDMLKHKLDNNQFAREIWNAAIEKAALAAVANGDLLEIHSPRIAEAIRKLKV